MNKMDHVATRGFFKEIIDPFLSKNNMSIKEFARGLGIDPKNVAKWENGILTMDSRDRKDVMKYINEYHNPKPEPVPAGLQNQMTEVKDITSREERLKTLPCWAVRILLKKYAEDEKISQGTLLDLIMTASGEKVSLPAFNFFLSGKTKQPSDKFVAAMKRYMALENMLGRYGMPDRPQTEIMKIEKPLAPAAQKAEPAVLSAARAGKHFVSANLDDNDFIDVLSSIGANPALPQERRRELIRLLFKQDFPEL